jgi:hypothetical protein
MRGADRVLKGVSLSDSGLSPGGSRVSAQRRYSNQKVGEMVYKAETEQSDYRRDRPANVFFSPDKYVGGIRINVYLWNSLILLFSSAGLLALLHAILSGQLRPAGKSLEE